MSEGQGSRVPGILILVGLLFGIINAVLFAAMAGNPEPLEVGKVLLFMAGPFWMIAALMGLGSRARQRAQRKLKE